MPLYDYRCSSCGQVREHRQKISDDPLTECPDCTGEYKRIITSVGVIFKGSGFHINDYRSSGGRDEATGSDKTPDKSSESKDSSSKDSPSATEKAETKPGDSKPPSEGAQGKQVA